MAYGDFRSGGTPTVSGGLVVQRARNMGYWLPCPDWASIGTGGSARATSINISGGDERNVTSSSAFANFVAGDMVFLHYENNVRDLRDYRTLVGIIGTVTSTSALIMTENMINHAANMDATPGDRYMTGSPVSDEKIATWYIPNDAFKGETYQSRTGRYAGQKIPMIRWKASAVINDITFYGNVRTSDENDQTVRERSRVYFSPIFQPDVINFSAYKDFGRLDGDEIVALVGYLDRLFVLKDRHTYVYNVQAGSAANWYLENEFKGYGISSGNAFAATPYGLIVADDNQISLMTPSGVQELSYPIRSAWQGLTKDRPVVGYSSKQKEVYITHDSEASDVAFHVFNFETSSWSYFNSAETNISNMVMGSNMEPVFLAKTGSHAHLRELNGSTGFSTAATIKTKRFDFGNPEDKKRFGLFHITYKSSSQNVTVNFYIDGAGSATKALTFSASSSITIGKDYVNLVGNTLEIEFTSTATDFVLEDATLEYEEVGQSSG